MACSIIKKISIVIPNWNGENVLVECIESIKRQSFKDYEIIIVDNGSEDSSLEVIRKSCSDAVVISWEENKGFCKAVNSGISHSHGQYIFLLNNDIILEKECLFILIDALNNDPDSWVVTPKIFFKDSNIIDTVGDSIKPGQVYKQGHLQEDNGAYDKERYVFSACAAASLYRRELFDHIGLFDEKYVTNLEDVDLCFRVQLVGKKCRFIPRAIAFHDVGYSKKRMNWDDSRNRLNEKYLWFKCMPGLTLLVNFMIRSLFYDLKIILVCCGVTRSGFVRPNFDKLLKIIWVYIRFILSIPYLLKERYRIQEAREVSAHYIRSFWEKEIDKVKKNTCVALEEE